MSANSLTFSLIQEVKKLAVVFVASNYFHTTFQILKLRLLRASRHLLCKGLRLC